MCIQNTVNGSPFFPEWFLMGSVRFAVYFLFQRLNGKNTVRSLLTGIGRRKRRKRLAQNPRTQHG